MVDFRQAINFITTVKEQLFISCLLVLFEARTFFCGAGEYHQFSGCRLISMSGHQNLAER